MKKRIYFTLFFLSILISSVKAQMHLTDYNGRQVPSKYTEVSGSAYFPEAGWGFGIVKLKNGATYKDVNVKLDQVEQKLIFKNEDMSLYFVDPVAEFKISFIQDNISQTKYYRTGYGSNSDQFYEVLADGTTQLLKLTTKSIKENREYGSAITVKTIDPSSDYFLFKDGKLIKVKRDKKFLFKTLGNKEPQLEAYIKTNALDLKNDADFGKLIMYYNSI